MAALDACWVLHFCIDARQRFRDDHSGKRGENHDQQLPAAAMKGGAAEEEVMYLVGVKRPRWMKRWALSEAAREEHRDPRTRAVARQRVRDEHPVKRGENHGQERELEWGASGARGAKQL